ncbi:hypothetical protein ACFLY1_01015, partial [Patescibacteria group bacterium]
RNGGCKIEPADPSLSDEKPVYYKDEIFDTSLDKKEYYRLILDIHTDKNTEISIKASDFNENGIILKKLQLKKDWEENSKEMFIGFQGEYPNLTFEKNDNTDGSNIFIDNVQVSKLEISSEAEFAKLIPTIRGNVDISLPFQEQEDNSKSFSQLCEPALIFGQVFKAQSDYITGISFDIDIIKQGIGGGRKHKLELREMDYGGFIPEMAEIKKTVLADITFSLKGIEKYRQGNGQFRFPLFSKLEKDKYYFIGINNDRAEVNKFNCLKPRGTTNGDAYEDGFTAIKKNSQTYFFSGDLYFILYGAEFKKYNNTNILQGSVIESIGNGKGLFKFNNKGTDSDIANLDSFTSDVAFDDIIFGRSAKSESNFVYKFETIFPFEKFNIRGNQADMNWSKTSISYSYDKNEWKEIPFSLENEMQHFDYNITEEDPKDKIYIKFSPLKSSTEKNKYGIEDFQVVADLLLK